MQASTSTVDQAEKTARSEQSDIDVDKAKHLKDNPLSNQE